MSGEGIYRVTYRFDDGAQGWYSVTASSEHDAREYGEKTLASEGWDGTPQIVSVRYLRDQCLCRSCLRFEGHKVGA